MSLLEKIKKKLKGKPQQEPQDDTEKDTQQPYTDEEEKKVKDRLRDLGYMD